ncbi:anillin isoform X2 [Kryptolebias marmoratus]|uniref:Anillin n=1 Tax=Kryptolebias marmoratus TaxID=37003 RepID=A0A3Q2ZAU3_KRYMA|nr:anillin isoform X2 [Kryptolebias marmoratus]
MDPFTEKLLERTRARRENLQKKLAERPNAANRQMVKRVREPLTDTNSVISDSVCEKAPQLSSKPSSSKRRCSEENLQPTADKEDQNPVKTRAVVPMLSDPSTDRKPPVGPVSIQPVVQLSNAQSEPEKIAVTPDPDDSSIGEAPTSYTLQRNKEDLVEHPASAAAEMKSRLQKLAEQRKFWDGDGAFDSVADCMPLSIMKRQVDVRPPLPTSFTSSQTPVGRKGRLANLAATIDSWEDESHAKIPSEKPCTGSVPKSAASTKTTSLPLNTESVSSSKQESLHSPVKSPQKAGVISSKLALESVHIPQKSSNQKAAFLSTSQKTTVPPYPLKNPALSKGLNHIPSPQKPELCDKPTVSSSVDHQDKVTAGGPGVKSFLERFGERCQERKEYITPTRVPPLAKRIPVTPSVTLNTRLLQEKLKDAQAANTTTAELTQRQKLERECELAQIRKCVWNGKDEKEDVDKLAQCKPEGESAASNENVDTPTKCTHTGTELVTPPALTSSPVKVVSPAKEDKTEKKEQKEEVKEAETNVDQSINSAVINELFNDVLEQSEEEEDALNISSMSLLTPLAETVAAVVKSPEHRKMTSTPTNSLIVKNNTPENISKPSRFQRTNMVGTASSDSVNVSDEDNKLPYSIDSYRSIRVKEPERPTVKQVIVRKDDSQGAEDPRGSCLFSIKQRMKVLTNEINLQQTIIHQASQALNCCTDEEHGKGSQVEAEAERLLLVATEKRESLKAELDRVKEDPAAQKNISSAAPEPASVSASKGSVTLQDLRLPLKADFVCSTANRPESTKHSFFILIRAGAENNVATPLASTHHGLSGDTLTFPTRFTLSDVVSDFKIELEVYCLVQRSEICSDKKKKPNRSKAITPKRFLAITKNAQTPVVASPGGPNAVRTSNFVLVGSHTLTLSSIGNNRFPLDKVPFLCPLEGHIHLKMQCEVGSKVEERGFLTMFEDVSGFGAWHRRWCVLSGYYLSYWMYPDDEKRKHPIGRISLTTCSSKKVEAANREFCARPNTFELITVRPQKEGDRETLVSQCTNTMCVTRNWMSADTKEERNLWMQKLNRVLMDLRMWQPNGCCKPL